MKRPPKDRLGFSVKEKDIEKAIRRYAVEKGCLCIKLSSPSNRGVPDRIILAPGDPGVVGFLEIKRPGNKPTKLQQSVLDKYNKMGFAAGWADSVEGGKVFINALMDTAAIKYRKDGWL